jgi:hypothetical protein
MGAAMTIGSFFKFSGLLLWTALALSACDSASGGKDDGDAASDEGDAGMDAAEPEERDASASADTGAPRDGGRDASSASDGGSAADAEDPYTCVPAPGPDGSIAEGEACCSGLGTCTVFTDDAGSKYSVGDCNAAKDLRCQPRTGDAGAAADGGTALPAKCRMRSENAGDGAPDYEGRCIPECLARGSSGLTRGECDASFLCVPCYNAITGDSTGVCESAGDHPVDPPLPGFDECGDKLGLCVPTASIGDAGTLQQLSCAESERCVPKQRVVAPDSCSAHCDSPFGAGACLPAFLIPPESTGVLQQGDCEQGELCTPCISPTTRMPTGACG